MSQTSWRSDHLRLRTFRARMVVAIVAAVAAVVVIQVIVTLILDARSVARIERALHAQASALAHEIDAAGPANVAATANHAAQILGTTRVTVRQDGLVVWWSLPDGVSYATASATSGPYQVDLESVDPVGTNDRWVIFAAILGGLIVSAVIVWSISGAFARRLRVALRELSRTADRIARGQLEARAYVTDDEVGTVARVFNRMAARLQREDARQREFLADVAHELRTPITAIEGFAHALHDGTARTAEAQAESAQIIFEEAARMREFVRDLQEITWLDLDPPVTRAAVHLGELARNEVLRQSVSATARGVQLIPPTNDVVVTSDPEHVRTIVANLLSNAIHATLEGGQVALTVGEGAGPDGTTAFVAVADTGVGIAPEHIPLLFERLFRVETARAYRDGKGSGLGLSIVQRLVGLLDGRIIVTSEVGVGSTFTLWLADIDRAGVIPRRATQD